MRSSMRRGGRFPLVRALQVVFGIFIFGVFWSYFQHARNTSSNVGSQWNRPVRPADPPPAAEVGNREPSQQEQEERQQQEREQKLREEQQQRQRQNERRDEEEQQKRQREKEKKETEGTGSIFDMKHVKDSLLETSKVTRGKRPRLLCFVMITDDLPFHMQVNRALKHWGPLTHQGSVCDLLKLSVPEDMKLPSNVTASDFWHVGSDTLFRRTYQTWLKAAEEAEDFDWFIKVSSDTIIFPENLRYYLSYYDASLPYYLGHTLFDFWRTHSVVYNHGAVYALSRGALNLVKPALEAIPTQKASVSLCIDRGRKEDREDVLMAICLRGVGIVPSNSLDRYYAQRFNILSIEVLLAVDEDEHTHSWGGHLKIEKPPWFSLLKLEPNGVSPSRGDTSYRKCCNLKPLSFGGFTSNAEDVSRDADLLTFGYNQNTQLFFHDSTISPGPFLYNKEALNFLIDDDLRSIEFCRAHQVAHCKTPLVLPKAGPQDPYLGPKVTVNPHKRPRVMVFAPMALTNADELAKNGVALSSWCAYFDYCKFGVSRESWEKLPEEQRESGHFLVLDTKYPDGRHDRNIWERSWRSWLAMAEDYLDKAEWFVKVDTDSFPLPDNMRNYMSYYNESNPHYLGHTIMYRWAENIVFNTGSGYMVSREALRLLRPIFRELQQSRQPKRQLCVDRQGPQEDMEFSRCLRLINVQPNDVLDGQNRYYMMTWRPDDHLHMKREETWFWEYKIKDVGQLQKCCNPKNMGYHNYKDQKDITVLLMRFIYLDNPQLYEEDTHVDPTALFRFDPARVDFDLDEFRNSKAICERPNTPGCVTEMPRWN